jgi:hypothetical protein
LVCLGIAKELSSSFDSRGKKTKMESVDDMQMMQVLKRDWCLDKVIRDRLVDKEKMKQLGIKSDRLAEVLAVTELACNAVYFEGLVLVRGGGDSGESSAGGNSKTVVDDQQKKK